LHQEPRLKRKEKGGRGRERDREKEKIGREIDRKAAVR